MDETSGKDPVFNAPAGAGFAFQFAGPEPSGTTGFPIRTSIPLQLGFRERDQVHSLLDASEGPAPPQRRSWSLDRWQAPGQTFELFQPLPVLMDFTRGPQKPRHWRDVSLPGIGGRFTVDNRQGERVRHAFVLIRQPRWQALERLEPGMYGWGDGSLGVAATFEFEATTLCPVRASAAIESIGEDGEWVGFTFEVPPGERRELLLAFARFFRGPEGLCPWYRAFFGGVEDVLEQLFTDFSLTCETVDTQDEAFEALSLVPSARDAVSNSIRGEEGHPVLLSGEQPRVAFVEADGSCNRLDSALRHQFLNFALHPWAMRSLLEQSMAPPPEDPLDVARWIVLAAGYAAASRKHDWLAGRPDWADWIEARIDDLQAVDDAPAERWAASLGAGLLLDALGRSDVAASYGDLARDIAGGAVERERLLLPWTAVEYWQHLGTPVDLHPFSAWRSTLALDGFAACCHALAERGGVLGVLHLADRLV